MMTSNYEDDGAGGGGIPWGAPGQDYAKQVGEQVLKAEKDLLFSLNRGTFNKKDIPRLIRLIQKSELLEHQNSQFAGLPTDQLEILLFSYASNGQEGFLNRAASYLRSLTGYSISAQKNRARSSKSDAFDDR